MRNSFGLAYSSGSVALANIVALLKKMSHYYFQAMLMEGHIVLLFELLAIKVLDTKSPI